MSDEDSTPAPVCDEAPLTSDEELRAKSLVACGLVRVGTVASELAYCIAFEESAGPEESV